MTEKTGNSADKKLLDSCWETVGAMSRDHRRAYVEAAGISVNRIVKSVPGLAEAVAEAKEQRRLREDARSAKAPDDGLCPVKANVAALAARTMPDLPVFTASVSGPAVPVVGAPVINGRRAVARLPTASGEKHVRTYTFSKDPQTGRVAVSCTPKPTEVVCVTRFATFSSADHTGMEERLRVLSTTLRGKKKLVRSRKLRPLKYGVKTYSVGKVDTGVKTYGTVEPLGTSMTHGPQPKDVASNPWWGLEE